MTDIVNLIFKYHAQFNRVSLNLQYKRLFKVGPYGCICYQISSSKKFYFNSHIYINNVTHNIILFAKMCGNASNRNEFCKCKYINTDCDNEDSDCDNEEEPY